MNKNHHRNKSNCTTSTITPLYTPPKPENTLEFSPHIYKQKLRIRTKQTRGRNPKIKCNMKCHPSVQCSRQASMGVQNKYVNWIVDNLLIGIYTNWLRLGPHIKHLVDATRRDKLDDIDRLLKIAQEQKERIQKLVKKVKQPRDKYLQWIKKQSQKQQINIQAIDKIQMIAKQLKFSTQLLSGQIVAQTRIIKSEKQNIFADSVFSHLIKNKKNHKKIYVNDNVKKVAETIVDRITVVKCLQSRNMKVNKKILKPLHRIIKQFQTSKMEQECITTEKVIKSIIQIFAQNEQNEKINGNLSKCFTKMVNLHEQAQQIKQVDKQKNNLDNLSQYSPSKVNLIIQEEQNDKKINTKSKQEQPKLETKKKIGFNIHTESDENEEHPRFDKKRSEMQENKKRSYLDRQSSKNKNTVHYHNYDKKGQIDSHAIHSRMKQQKESQKRLKYEKNGLSSNYLNYKSDQIIDNEQSIKQNESDHPQEDINQHKNQIFQSEIESNISLFQQSHQNNRRNNNKYQKLDKSLRKNVIKKAPTPGLDLIDLQNFQMELQKEQNVVVKKRKILDLFNTIEVFGGTTSKSIKKLITQAQNIEEEIKTRNNLFKQRIKRNNLHQDPPISSFFRIPFLDDDRNSELSMHSCKPYQYLTKFNKQAINNWNQKSTGRIFRISDVPKARFSELGCDLHMPVINKQSVHHKKWSDRENTALQFGLQFIKKHNLMAIQQKGVNIEKQQVI